jgi:hypothetical protein
LAAVPQLESPAAPVQLMELGLMRYSNSSSISLRDCEQFRTIFRAVIGSVKTFWRHRRSYDLKSMGVPRVRGMVRAVLSNCVSVGRLRS